MSALTIPTANMSLKIPVTDKEALQNLAKQRKRSTHFVMLEMIQKGLQEAKEQAEYEQWVEQRVMAVYDRVKKQGSSGKTAEQVHSNLKEKMKLYAQNK